MVTSGFLHGFSLFFMVSLGFSWFVVVSYGFFLIFIVSLGFSWFFNVSLMVSQGFCAGFLLFLMVSTMVSVVSLGLLLFTTKFIMVTNGFSLFLCWFLYWILLASLKVSKIVSLAFFWLLHVFQVYLNVSACFSRFFMVSLSFSYARW